MAYRINLEGILGIKNQFDDFITCKIYSFEKFYY